MTALKIVNPSTAEIIQSVHSSTIDEVDAAVQRGCDCTACAASHLTIRTCRMPALRVRCRAVGIGDPTTSSEQEADRLIS